MVESEFRNPRSGTRKPVIGLAGGIGSGKTTVAAEFARLGCVVLDSDQLAHRALEEPQVVQQIRQWWGDGVLDETGQPDRKKIAERVFDRPDELARLNALVHPRVLQMHREQMAARADDPAVVAFVLDMPLLFEVGFDRECDATVFVEVPLAVRQARLAKARGWDAAELDRRQRHQMAAAEKQARCDYVVRNDGSLDGLARQVRQVLDRILACAAEAGPGRSGSSERGSSGVG